MVVVVAVVCAGGGGIASVGQPRLDWIGSRYQQSAVSNWWCGGGAAPARSTLFSGGWQSRTSRTVTSGRKIWASTHKKVDLVIQRIGRTEEIVIIQSRKRGRKGEGLPACARVCVCMMRQMSCTAAKHLVFFSNLISLTV